jgi:hypothetical protein
MLENPRKTLPADQDPSPEDEQVREAAPKDYGIEVRKRVEVAKEGSVPDIMGQVIERDKSAQAAEEWLDGNDLERGSV